MEAENEANYRLFAVRLDPKNPEHLAACRKKAERVQRAKNLRDDTVRDLEDQVIENKQKFDFDVLHLKILKEAFANTAQCTLTPRSCLKKRYMVCYCTKCL